MSSSSILGGRTLKEYWEDVAERGRNGPGPKIIKVKFSDLDFSKGRKEYNPDHFLEELARITGSKETVADVRDSYLAMVNARLTHGHDVCKYLGTEPPKKGGANMCGICDGEHRLTGCPYWESVPQDAYVGPCFVILCRLCGTNINTTRFCPFCRRAVNGYVSERVCDCCCKTMWSGCDCHFECSTSSISEPGPQPVPPPPEN